MIESHGHTISIYPYLEQSVLLNATAHAMLSSRAHVVRILAHIRSGRAAWPVQQTSYPKDSTGKKKKCLRRFITAALHIYIVCVSDSRVLFSVARASRILQRDDETTPPSRRFCLRNI